MAKKKPAKPAKKPAPKAASRKPERSKGELSSEDLDSVAGGILIGNQAIEIASIKGEIKQVKIAPGGLALPSTIKDLGP